MQTLAKRHKHKVDFHFHPLLYTGREGICHFHMQFPSSPGASPSSHIFGASGDFITSPELSQLFGEMLGVWCVHELRNSGYGGGAWQLVEVGPGTGQLVNDVLTVLRQVEVLGGVACRSGPCFRAGAGDVGLSGGNLGRIDRRAGTSALREHHAHERVSRRTRASQRDSRRRPDLLVSHGRRTPS